jgi:hypothetical protein
VPDSEPSRSTIKRLFALSGNRCAFPKCPAPLAQDNTLVGEVCHIKGKQPDAARYDPQQTPAERNAFENLILMCPTHHTVIDCDDEAYTVERVRKLKADYEAHATPIDDATAEKVAASYMVVSTVAQIGGITANQITGSTINLNTGQIVDPVVLRHQLEAKENLWDIICKLREEFGMVLYIDNIFTVKEIDEFFAEGKHRRAIGIVDDYRSSRYSHDKITSVNPEKERPFISPKLWSIVFIIRALYGRASVLIKWSFERHRYQDWHTDNGMDQILRSQIPVPHVDDIKKRPIGGLNAAVDYLQHLFLIEAGMQGNQ